jgi:hypothetical protein
MIAGPETEMTDDSHVLALLQASCGDVGRIADSVAGYEKFNSPVLLAAGGAIV